MYFITLCTKNRRPILAVPEVAAALAAFGQRGHEELGVELGRYVVMPDHLHAFVCLPPTIGVSRWTKALKRTLSVLLNQAGQPKPNWQRGSWDRLMRRRETYDEKWEYVRQNPVRAGLVTQSDDWPLQGEVIILEWPV